MEKTFNNIYKGKTVLVTGHTGFKGSWLALWLSELGANVIGFSLPEPNTVPSNFGLSKLEDHITDVRGDIRNLEEVISIIKKYKPEVVFHLAAQAIVLRSYDEPKLTIDTNAGGTVNVLEAIRQTDSVKAYVSITSDKVYKNKEWPWGYRETDELGEKDPYGASKGMAELAINSYRQSFFSNENYAGNKVQVASTRAGNVVGGGDFADYRLVPDCARALIAGKPIGIRNPNTVRPWQLVLEPISGYLWLGAKLLENISDRTYAKAWNFGPLNRLGITSGEVADLIIELWGEGSTEYIGTDTSKGESGLLMLDWSLAWRELGWKPIYSDRQTIQAVVEWYKDYGSQMKKDKDNVDMYDVCVKQIKDYTDAAHNKKLEWAGI